MNKQVNHTIRMGIIYLIVLGSVACQTQKPGKPTVKDHATTEQNATEDAQLRQRELERLTLCQNQLASLIKINPKQHQQYKQVFDSLMNSASQYASLRGRVNNNTQETIDSLYRYKINYLCASISQAVLTGLTEKAEQVKEGPVK
ncbi:hypothetical protein QZQ97_24340 [Serratia sp. root2]|uniref:hypothetical protein n=1 Tax=Serratia sp. root2 TaxID=3059676 RepID=UPI00288CC69A|nr:hypothetical protein [Serratia sp. root2]MDT3254050.1 hypothetical protein [Serratia sp. root2]